jgi:LasA protease
MIKPAAGLGGIMVAACMLLVACRNVTPTAQSEQASALFETMQAMTTPVQAVVLPTELATQAISSGPVLQSPEETSAATTTPGNEAASPTSLPTAPAITLVPPAGFVVYITKPGETLRRLADRFELRLDALIVQQPFPPDAYLPEGLQLIMPEIHNAVTPPDSLLPDSELVYSPSAVDFDTAAFVNQAGGFLSTYVENVDGQNMSGAEIVQRVANELSVNPRLLLAVLEERSGWVYGQPKDPNRVDYPIGFMATGQVGLYDELRIAGTQLNLAYYGYKEGSYILIRFANGSALRLHPFMNPGTAGLHNLFAMFYTPSNWWQKLAGINGFMALYQDMFGDPWARAAAVEPLIPYDLTQPVLELPFPPGEYWSFTSGPHWAWNYGTPRGALDFAPANNEERCEVSKQWATASAAGVIARAANNAVALDLDRDGLEQTGWVLVYLHLAGEGLIQPGIHVQVDDPLGHPSCQGGSATGTHVHLARKFNGEWLDAEWLAPFVLSGYQVRGNGTNYQGELVNGDLTIAACPYGCKGALIKR